MHCNPGPPFPCETLNRRACSDSMTPSTCGECQEGFTSDINGDSNTPCERIRCSLSQSSIANVEYVSCSVFYGELCKSIICDEGYFFEGELRCGSMGIFEGD